MLFEENSSGSGYEMPPFKTLKTDKSAKSDYSMLSISEWYLLLSPTLNFTIKLTKKLSLSIQLINDWIPIALGFKTFCLLF